MVKVIIDSDGQIVSLPINIPLDEWPAFEVTTPATVASPDSKVGTPIIAADVVLTAAVAQTHQWMKDGVDLPGETGASYTPVSVGKYKRRSMLEGWVDPVFSNEIDVTSASTSAFPYPIVVQASVWRPVGQEVWYTPVVNFTGIGSPFKLAWTTSGAAVPAANQIEESVVDMGGGNFQIFMEVAGNNNPGGVPRTDYSVFRTSDGGRHNALRYQVQLVDGGPWSDFSDPITVVPAVPVETPVATGEFVPVIHRNLGQYNAKKAGGPGYQILRSLATSPAAPDLIFASVDQNTPWISRDGWGSIRGPKLAGLYMGRSGVSVWVDPQDANRMVITQANPEHSYDRTFDEFTGIYLSTDGGATCSLVQTLNDLTGTQHIRHHLHLICNAPGGTPTTRTVYCMRISKGTNASSVTAALVQLWRSTNGGSTWALRGGNLSVGTYCSGANGPYGISCAANGDLYQWGIKGAWRSTDGGLTWGSRLGTPSGAVNRLDVQGVAGEVWAAVSDGLYKSTNSGSSFTRNSALGTKNVKDLAISPANRSYMIAQINGQTAPSYSHNGGTSWAVGTSNKMLGQDDTFTHSMGNSSICLLPKVDDRNVCFAATDAHARMTRDGGATWNAAGAYFDGTDTRGMGFNPTNWLDIVEAQQDKGIQRTTTGGWHWEQDPITSSNEIGVAIKTAIGDNQNISGGSTIVAAGGGRVVSLQGHVNSGRVPVIFQSGGGTSIGAATVKGSEYKVYMSEFYGGLNPRDVNQGWLGELRVGSLNAGSASGVTFFKMARGFFGAYDTGSATHIYGVNKDTTRNLYKSTDLGTTWSLWHTTSSSFRPMDNMPVLAVSRATANRVYAAASGGRMIRIDSGVETVLFDVNDYVGSAHGRLALNAIAVDPFNPNLLYIALSMWGIPPLWRSTNGGSTWTDISAGLPNSDFQIWVHPLTSDLFAGGSHGTHVLPPPAGHRTTYGITNSIYDRTVAYLAEATI